MKHEHFQGTNTPWDPANLKLSYTYTNFPDFRRDHGIAGTANSGFWHDLHTTPYAYQDMADNLDKISAKFEQKNRENINSKIEAGQIGQKFLLHIVPGKQNSTHHAYLFFPTKANEINTELASTFNV
jgi:hypothetical protein